MNALVVVACAFGGMSGSCLFVAALRALDARQRVRRAKALMKGQIDGRHGDAARVAGGSFLLQELQRQSDLAHPGGFRGLAQSRIWSLGMKDAPGLLERAGLSGLATPAGMRRLRIQATGVGAAIGCLVGGIFSLELAALLAIAGMVAGYRCVTSSLRREAANRTADMERHLSEMVEVMLLGLRGGLSFERSFLLYPRYFDAELGRSMTRAARRWGMGLSTREDSLRAMEAEYASPLLSRVVDSMVRSLRFGTPMSESLEAAAIEARETHRTRMEERVAKVAVKMMLPVGALILPAMLLLVMGPVLLELMDGF